MGKAASRYGSPQPPRGSLAGEAGSQILGLLGAGAAAHPHEGRRDEQAICVVDGASVGVVTLQPRSNAATPAGPVCERRATIPATMSSLPQQGGGAIVLTPSAIREPMAPDCLQEGGASLPARP